MGRAAGRAGAPVDVVVFDVGNVLVQWDRDLLYRELIPDPGTRAWFLDEVVTIAWNHELDRGRPFDEAVAELSRQHPDWAAEIAAYRDRWSEMLGPADPDAVSLVDELQTAGRRVIGLTNFSAETYPVAESRHEVLRRLDAVVVSGREGLVKPEPAVFELLCSRHGVDPTRLVFVDDSCANVEGARAVGWEALLWTGAEPFRRYLCDRGIL
jgi:2-haloacid dehalogenase